MRCPVNWGFIGSGRPDLLVSGEECTIGRDEDCQVSIPVLALSRLHAILLSEGGEHFVQDLESRNCTYRKGVSGCGLKLVGVALDESIDSKFRYFLG